MLYDALMRFAMRIIELHVVPDWVLRRGIRFLLSLRLRELKAPTGEEQQRRLLVRLRLRRACFRLQLPAAWLPCSRSAATATVTRAGVCCGPQATADCGTDRRRQRAALRGAH
jgi:hypothetical protein